MGAVARAVRCRLLNVSDRRLRVELAAVWRDCQHLGAGHLPAFTARSARLHLLVTLLGILVRRGQFARGW